MDKELWEIVGCLEGEEKKVFGRALLKFFD